MRDLKLSYQDDLKRYNGNVKLTSVYGCIYTANVVIAKHLY